MQLFSFKMKDFCLFFSVTYIDLSHFMLYDNMFMIRYCLCYDIMIMIRYCLCYDVIFMIRYCLCYMI